MRIFGTRIRLTLSIVFAFNFLQVMGQQGITLRKRTVSGLNGGQSLTSTLYISGSRVRESSESGSDFLLLLDERKFVTLDHPNQSYSEFSFEKLAAEIEQAAERLAQQEDAPALASMRKSVGEIGPLQVEELEQSELFGFRVQKYRIHQAPVEWLLWMAPELKLPPVYYDSLKVRAAANPLFDLHAMYDAMKKIGGVSLRTEMTIQMMGMTVKSSSEVVEVVRAPVPALIFQVPEGYREEDAFQP